MDFDLEKLKRLRHDVEFYLLCINLEIDDENLFKELRNENVVEYEKTKAEIIDNLVNKSSTDVIRLLEEVNLRDFDIHKISHDLTKLGSVRWHKRSHEEILRDQLLDIDNYLFYLSLYEKNEKFKEIQRINIERLESRDEIKITLKDFFKEKFKVEFLNGTILVLDTDGDYVNFFDKEAKSVFDLRNSTTIDRDTYGYITIYDYSRALEMGFKEAKDELQAEIKNELINKIREYLKQNPLSKSEVYDYHSYGLDSKLYSFVLQLFENRNEDKKLKEECLLIKFNTYIEWCRSTIKEQENQFNLEQTNDTDDDIDDDFHEFDYPFNMNPGYEKYGGYNGYDDDTIDDAFEGDPENTWNVD